jgi:hypothetical protein
MAVLKEWTCLAHGAFDGYELDDGAKPHCPHGCVGMTQRAFRTAPAFQTKGYRNMNSTFETLAREQGVSNLDNRGGGGMRRADYATHKRLNDATAMIMHASKSGMKGHDASQFFRPLDQYQAGSTGEGGAMRKENGVTTVAGVPLTAPGVQVEGRPFNGQSLGVPIEKPGSTA